MLDRVGEYFKEIVALVFTLLVIGFGIQVWNIVSPVNDAIREQAIVRARMSEEAKYSAYNNHLLSGSAISTAVKKYADIPRFCVYVGTDSTNSNFNRYSYDGGQCYQLSSVSPPTASTTVLPSSNTYQQMVTEGTPVYVDIRNRYRSSLVRDGNDRITGIVFFRQ